MGLDGESRRRFSLKFDFGGGGKAKWKRGTNFSCPLSMGTMGGEDVQFFMATSFVLKRRATRLAGNARPFLFFLYYFLFLFSTLPPRIPHYYVYITSNSPLSLSLSFFHKRRNGRNGVIAREKDEPFIRENFQLEISQIFRLNYANNEIWIAKRNGTRYDCVGQKLLSQFFFTG